MAGSGRSCHGGQAYREVPRLVLCWNQGHSYRCPWLKLKFCWDFVILLKTFSYHEQNNIKWIVVSMDVFCTLLDLRKCEERSSQVTKLNGAPGMLWRQVKIVQVMPINLYLSYPTNPLPNKDYTFLTYHTSNWTTLFGRQSKFLLVEIFSLKIFSRK